MRYQILFLTSFHFIVHKYIICNKILVFVWNIFHDIVMKISCQSNRKFKWRLSEQCRNMFCKQCIFIFPTLFVCNSSFTLFNFTPFQMLPIAYFTCLCLLISVTDNKSVIRSRALSCQTLNHDFKKLCVCVMRLGCVLWSY